MSDERHGLPSASSAHRYALCPGSFLLEQSINEPEQSSDDANTGNRIHAALAGEKIELSDDELSLAVKCTNQEENLVRDVFGLGMTLDSSRFMVIRERRLWAIDDDLKKGWSGKPDAVYNDATKALVIDYKTGRGSVEQAAGNRQLRALVVLVDAYFGPFDQITAAIIQPLAGEPSTCVYTRQDIETATAEINGLMKSVKSPGQPRNPSTEACKYCKAKSVCPEAQGVVEKLPSVIQRDGMEIVMSPDQIAAFLEKAPLAEAVIESVRGKARRMLQAGESIPGWKLKPGAIRETIVNPELAFARFIEGGGTQQQFVGAISVTKTKFKDAVKAATNKKGRELEGIVESMLEGCTESKVTSPSLVQEKEAA